jgi:hypothetical protein
LKKLHVFLKLIRNIGNITSSTNSFVTVNSDSILKLSDVADKNLSLKVGIPVYIMGIL